MVWLAVLSIVREITDSLHPSKEPQRGGPIKALGKSMRAQRALTQPRVGDRTRVGRVGWFASKRRLDEAEIGRGLFRSRQTAAGVADRLLDRHRGGEYPGLMIRAKHSPTPWALLEPPRCG